jgi:hypothetical protein
MTRGDSRAGWRVEAAFDAALVDARTPRGAAATGSSQPPAPAVVRRRLVTLQRVELQRRIAEGAGEFLLFALTPPRLTTEPEQASQIAAKTLERLRPVGLDGLVLYDIDDESDRNPEERPFPFLPTMDPADYLARYLVALEVPAIVYRAVSKYPEQGLRSWLSEQTPTHVLSVFVGASSREKAVATSLLRAYELRTEVRPDLLLGGVAIPERHRRGRGEHVRLLAKQAASSMTSMPRRTWSPIITTSVPLVTSSQHPSCSRSRSAAR